ncbi:MAG: hypothetical protein PHC60_09325 [Heliobacteriaceae bacterium]|nr:hypothetical protein [Heliobacteriaceae bacterium]
MSTDFKVMRQSLDLSETMQKGISHIRAKFIAGDFETALFLLQDLTQALISIQEAGRQVLAAETFAALNAASQELQNGLANLIWAYETHDWGKVVSTLDSEIIPGFQRWKTTLERIYGPPTAS